MLIRIALVSALLVSGPIPFGLSQTQAIGGQRSASPVELSTFLPNLVHPADSSQPLWVSSGILNGNILKKAVPIFPPKTNCLHISGVVRVHAIIGKDGHVTRAQANFGAEIMRQPAVDAILQWVYRPFQLHGQPVEVET